MTMIILMMPVKGMFYPHVQIFNINDSGANQHTEIQT
jgi:hypothetical protein